MTALPVTVTNISEAKLPASYEAARTAIAECERIDECKTWADKAAAIKAYAIMQDDRTLHNTALRIQLRAERRLGELLKEVEPQPGKRTDLEPSGGTPTRLQMAKTAGLSRDQMHTALRVASIPKAKFDSAVESVSPPTVTQLAEQGKAARGPVRQLSPWAAMECSETRVACETLQRFATYCQGIEPAGICRAINAVEAAALSDLICITRDWLDQMAACLTADGE